jgi:PilZ domain
MLERRQESRKQLDIAVRISGRDVSGEPFAQSAVASSISGGGALLSGMERQVRTGDLVWVEYEERKARFRIVWVRDSESGRKTQAAIHRLENEACPWAGL